MVQAWGKVRVWQSLFVTLDNIFRFDLFCSFDFLVGCSSTSHRSRTTFVHVCQHVFYSTWTYFFLILSISSPAPPNRPAAGGHHHRKRAQRPTEARLAQRVERYVGIGRGIVGVGEGEDGIFAVDVIVFL
jgi:hypothetical protein